MTISSETMRQPAQAGNGVTTSFDYDFKIFDDDHLLVIVTDSEGVETVKTKPTHYTVSGVESETGGSVDFVTAPASGEDVHIILDPDFTQEANLNADEYEKIFDKIVQMNQRTKDIVTRSLTLTETSTVGSGEFDLGGQVIKNSGTAVDDDDLISKGDVEAITAADAAAAAASAESAAASEASINVALLDLDGVAISALTPATSFEDTDILPIYDNSAGDNAGITWANVKTALGDLASKNTVSTEDLDDGVNTTAKYADGSITTAKYADGSITKAKLHADYNQLPLLHIQDQKSSNTDGGTFTSGAWRTRDLNAILTNQITGASLSSNQITLPVGSYRVKASAPSYNSESHRLRLYDVTNTTELLLGTSEYSRNIYAGSTRAFLSGRINLTSQSTIELQHRCANTTSSEGFGIGNGFGTEIYSEIEIYEVA